MVTVMKSVIKEVWPGLEAFMNAEDSALRHGEAVAWQTRGRTVAGGEMFETLLLTLALTGGPAAGAPPRPAPTATEARRDRMVQEEIEEFLEEVEEYLEHRTKAREELPKLKDQAEPEEVTAYAKGLADNIRERRKGAKQGDIFTPRLARAFQRIFARELARTGHDRQVVLTEGNPTGDEERMTAPKVVVNGQYIPAAPLSTMPPTLLLALPTLPDEVEYRFVGRSLILRDTVANLIIDFIPNAVP
jgi:hypothetical protein